MKILLTLILLLNINIHANQHIIFVPGYHNEKIGSYFEEHIKQLRQQGYANVQKISLKSEVSITNNSDQLAKILSKKRGQLFIIAHSKGGLEVLNTYLKNPKLTSRTSKIILMQSPLQGSPYADFFWEESDYNNQFNPAYWWYSRYMYSGFLSMRSDQVKKSITESSHFSTVEDLNQLSNKIYYWRSEKSLPQPFYKQYQESLSSYGPNDGLVPSTHMLITEFKGIYPFGHDLGIHHNISHLELVSSTIEKEEQYKKRVTLFLKEIFNIRN